MPPEDSSTSSQQEPAPEASQPVPESPSPVVEVPAETPPSEPTPSTPEPAPAPAEATPAPESVQSAPEPSSAPATEATPVPEIAPDSAEATTGTQPPTPTAQMGRSEPLPPEPEPFDFAPDSAKATPGTQDKPTPEPPSAAASAPAPVIPQTGILHAVHDVLVKARVAIQDHKRKKRDKIMAALNTKSKITNDEVEKLLHVSDATATRYLSALAKEGKIIQVGKQGKGVLYIKTP